MSYEEWCSSCHLVRELVDWWVPNESILLIAGSRTSPSQFLKQPACTGTGRLSSKIEESQLLDGLPTVQCRLQEVLPVAYRQTLHESSQIEIETETNKN
jgi:hypothetical protein